MVNGQVADIKKFMTFEDLEIYRKAPEFRKKIYELIRILPPEERYSLDPQMRRAIVSVRSNVAEGHGRYHYGENMQFCRQSRGSLEEIIDDLNVCFEEKYSDEDHIIGLKNYGYDLLESLNGYIKYLKSIKESSQ